MTAPTITVMRTMAEAAAAAVVVAMEAEEEEAMAIAAAMAAEVATEAAMTAVTVEAAAATRTEEVVMATVIVTAAVDMDAEAMVAGTISAAAAIRTAEEATATVTMAVVVAMVVGAVTIVARRETEEATTAMAEVEAVGMTTEGHHAGKSQIAQAIVATMTEDLLAWTIETAAACRDTIRTEVHLPAMTVTAAWVAEMMTGALSTIVALLQDATSATMAATLVGDHLHVTIGPEIPVTTAATTEMVAATSEGPEETTVARRRVMIGTRAETICRETSATR